MRSLMVGDLNSGVYVITIATNEVYTVEIA